MKIVIFCWAGWYQRQNSQRSATLSGRGQPWQRDAGEEQPGAKKHAGISPQPCCLGQDQENGTPTSPCPTGESWVCRRVIYRLHAPWVDKLVGAGLSSEKRWQAGTCVLPPRGTKACRDSSLRCLFPAVVEGNRSWQWHLGGALPGSGMGLFPSPQHHVTPRSISKGAEHYKTSTSQLGKAKGCPC